jgi:predicted metal-binding membrane protein
VSDRAVGISRSVTIAAFVAVTAVSWLLLARSAAVMSAMSGEGVLLDLAFAMMQPAATAPYLLASALMWGVMMVAMMTPALLTVLVLFQRLERKGAAGAHAVLFASGYIAVWLGFAVIATLLQWALHRAALLHGHVLSAGPQLAGVILVAAGIYQLTPLKTACLSHCQTPIGFLSSHWREGASGALRMGLDHGGYCLGCCWALMLLMFVGGVMSVTAMAVLSVFILAERLLPPGPLVAQLPGIALLVWGAWTLLAGGG